VDGVVVETIPLVEDPAQRELSDIPLESEPASQGVPPARRSRARVGAWLGVAAALLLAVLPLVRDSLEEGPPPVTQSLGASRPTEEPRPSPTFPPQANIEVPAYPADLRPAAPSRSGGPEHDAARSIAQAPQPAISSQASASDRSAAAPARRLTDEAIAYSPAFAPADSAMFYQAQNEGGSALLRADTDGEGSILRITRVVDDKARNFHARPSPDGRKIAFDSDREGERAVYVANADGTDVKRVSGDGYAAVPSWSPDGRTLAFIRAEPDRPRVWNIWTVDLETGDLRRLTAHTYGQPWGGSWFPDGRRMAYSHEDRLIILDVDTGGTKVFRSPRKGRLVRTPAVSPDGRWVIFQVYRDGAWLLDLEDGSMLKILADPTAEEYAWSPDGRRVAYHSRRSGQWGVWLMSPR
jgi:Tol biopolymer transport system component